MTYSARELSNMKQKLRQIRSVGFSDADARKILSESTRNTGFGSKVLMTAAALPLGAALLGASTAAYQKASELAPHLGIRNPMDSMIIRKAMDKVYARNPELAGIDRKRVEERARMLYSASPVLFEAENTEVLENILLNMRSYNGADYKLLKDLSSMEKEIRAKRQMGTSSKDMASIGTLMIR